MSDAQYGSVSTARAKYRGEVWEDRDYYGGHMFKAACECGWSADRWHHADVFAGDPDRSPLDIACDEADADLGDHLETHYLTQAEGEY